MYNTIILLLLNVKIKIFFNLVHVVELVVINLDTSNGSKNILMEGPNTSAILTNESLRKILRDLKNNHPYSIH